MEKDHVEQLLTEREAAKRLRMHFDTLGKLRRAGGIGHLRFGGRIRYTEENLREYLEGAHVPATQPVVRALPTATSPPAVRPTPEMVEAFIASLKAFRKRKDR